MNTLKLLCFAAILGLVASCDREDEDIVSPRNPEDFPIVILLSDEGDGDVEDNDEVGIDLEILPVWDPVSRDPEGIIMTPASDMRITFEIYDLQGFASLNEYVTGGFAVYEIDDCTDSSDEDIDLDFTIDLSTGEGSFTWPAGIEELEVVIEVNEALFADDVLNPDRRGFSFRLTGIEGPGAGSDVRVNTDLEFEYFVLDDESIFGDWELDHNDPVQLAAFLDLFGPLNEDFQGLEAADIDKIEISFKFDEMEAVVALAETEEDECEPGEFGNVEADLAAGYEIAIEDLFGATSGDLEFEDDTEIDGLELEFVLEGSFKLDPEAGTLILILQGELDGEEINEQTLELIR